MSQFLHSAGREIAGRVIRAFRGWSALKSAGLDTIGPSKTLGNRAQPPRTIKEHLNGKIPVNDALETLRLLEMTKDEKQTSEKNSKRAPVRVISPGLVNLGNTCFANSTSLTKSNQFIPPRQSAGPRCG
jgi:hypothetical protein